MGWRARLVVYCTSASLTTGARGRPPPLAAASHALPGARPARPGGRLPGWVLLCACSIAASAPVDHIITITMITKKGGIATTMTMNFFSFVRLTKFQRRAHPHTHPTPPHRHGHRFDDKVSRHARRSSPPAAALLPSAPALALFWRQQQSGQSPPSWHRRTMCALTPDTLLPRLVCVAVRERTNSRASCAAK